MRILSIVGLAMVIAAGCGGATQRTEDEVPATWTAGDDAPLEGTHESGSDGTSDAR